MALTDFAITKGSSAQPVQFQLGDVVWKYLESKGDVA